MRFEYKVVPAPNKGKRVKGVRSTEGRFAAALENIMSTYGADGWAYVGRETHEMERRKGLFRRKEILTKAYLVFRRSVVTALDAEATAPTEPTLTTADIHTESETLSAPEDLARQVSILAERLEGIARQSGGAEKLPFRPREVPTPTITPPARVAEQA